MLVTKRNFNSVMRTLRKSGATRVVADTETTGLNVHLGDRVCGVALRLPDLSTPAYYFPCRHDGGNLSAGMFMDMLEWLSSPGIVRTGWNWKFDLKMLHADGFPIPDYDEDVMLGAHLANENEINYKLKEWADRYIAAGSSAAEARLKELLVSRGLGKGSMWQLHARDVEEYATADVDLTERARRVVMKSLKAWKLKSLWKEVNEYMIATVHMEMRGFLLDVPLIREYIEEAKVKREEALNILRQKAGYDLNPNSHKQIQAFLGLPSSAKEFLEPYIGKNEAVDAVVHFRQWDKVNGTYYLRYLEKMDENNVLYPNIKLHGTIAGRPSAEDPNLQAVPRKSDVYKVKNVFKARPGFLYLSADYSQAELRYCAHEADDRNMQKAFASGLDFHQTTADNARIERDEAKRINFGVVYGLAAPGLSKKLKIKRALAQEFLDRWYRAYPRVRPRRMAVARQAKSRGYIRLWTGRVRRYYTQRFPEPHKALSNKIQGGVAEIMRHAITRLHREIRHGRMNGCHMLMQVHDQILFEIPEDRLHQIVPIIVEHMTTFPQFKVPFKVDVSVGNTWGGAKPYTKPEEPEHGRRRDGSRRGAVRVRRKGRHRRAHGAGV